MKTNPHRIALSIGTTLTLALMFAGPANGVVITAPGGVLAGTPSPGASDPEALDTWMRRNVRTGASVGITADYPRDGDGSAFLSSADSGGKADWEYLPTGGFGTLASVGSYSYSWYRDGVSTVAAHLHPVMRLIVDIDGDPVATPNDIAYLVFERAYNPSTAAVPTNTWTTETIGAATNLWVSQPGVGIEEVYNRTLADYQAGSYTPTPGWSQITGNSRVLGISLGIGSGWDGVYRGAVDGPTIAGYTANFELTAPAAPAAQAAVPAMGMAGLAVLGFGLAAVAGWRRRSRG